MSATVQHKPTHNNEVWSFPLEPYLKQQAHQYGELREKEGRLFTDEQLATLPDLDPAHPLAAEFRIRKYSMKRLLKYLKRSEVSSVLEIGCGNGWLLAQVTSQLGIEGTGVDIFRPELEQAARVFSDAPIDWIQGNIFREILPPASFDAVIVASAAQYFNNLGQLIDRAKTLLRDDGCLHIIDTPFYRANKVKQVTTRTYNYYESISMPWMTGQYFHHTYKELNGINYRFLHKPTAIGKRFRRIMNKAVVPFPHIQISKTP